MTPERAHRTQPHPLNWEMKKIGDVFSVVERPVEMENDKPYRRVTVKRRYGGIELRDVRRGEEIKVKNQFLIKAGDFLISERQIVHGACGIVPAALDGALVSNEYLVLEPRCGFEVSYFNYLVQLLEYAKLFLLCSQGVDIEKFLFKPHDWLKKVVPAPPHAEQKKIAAILTTVDDKLDVIARQIETTQTLKQGLMQTLFTRGAGTQDARGLWVPHAEQKPTALGMVPASWVVEPLDRHVSKVGSGVTPKGGSTSYQSSGVPLIRSQNVLVGRLSLDDVAYIDEVQHNKMRNSALEPEDVLLNITGASIGRCAVLPRNFSEGNVNQHVCIIRTLPSLNPQFLCQYINSYSGQKQVAKFQAGGNREGLNYQQVRSFDVPVPSIGEQEKIVDLLEAVDGRVRHLEQKHQHYQSLKRGLMQKLLTGMWRVRIDAEMAA